MTSGGIFTSHLFATASARRDSTLLPSRIRPLANALIWLHPAALQHWFVISSRPIAVESIADPAFAVLDLPSVPSTRLALTTVSRTWSLFALPTPHCQHCTALTPAILLLIASLTPTFSPYHHEFHSSSAWTCSHSSTQPLLDSSLTFTLTVRH